MDGMRRAGSSILKYGTRALVPGSMAALGIRGGVVRSSPAASVPPLSLRHTARPGEGVYVGRAGAAPCRPEASLPRSARPL